MTDGAAAKGGKTIRLPLPESHRVLVERVASSSVFRKSPRLRELFLFVCERALADPPAVVHEQEIGVAVFGRPEGYDTGQDNLVRVQASQLRKKLEQYFLSDGHDEPVVIEIPKGAYTPVFRSREAATVPSAGSPSRLRGMRAYPWPLLLVLLASAGAGALAMWLASRPTPAGAGSRSGPAMTLFWRQVLGNGRPACVVASDANLVLFQDLLRRQLTVNEYRQNAFFRIADEELARPDRRALAKAVIDKAGTHIADARLVGMIQAVNAANRIHTDVVFARDFGVSYLQSHNAILLGTRRANPWVELFENQFNFRTRFREAPTLACYFENRAPIPGERAIYAVDWGRRGYCRVVFLPNPARDGNVLVISGTDMASTEAGGQFIGAEWWIQLLRSRLGLRDGEPFPYLEVLLEVEFPATRASRFRIVAHRVTR
jgi:hypothetical protein